MGASGIQGLANPDGTTALFSGVAASQFASLTDRGSVDIPTINAPTAAALAGKQATLVSGTSLKTINSGSLLGSGDVVLQAPLVSGTTIKTINSGSLLGSGDISIQPTLVSASNIKTVNGNSLLGSGDLAVSANSNPTLVTHSDAIPLDTSGFGKSANAIVTLSADRTLTLGSSPMEGGSYEVIFQQNATGSWAVSPPGTWIKYGVDVLGNTPGARARYVFEYVSGDVIYVVVPLTGVDITPPTLSSAIVSDTNAVRIDLVWSEPINSSISAASAFAVSSGHTVTTHTYVDSTHTYLTLATPFVSGETKTLSYTQPGTNNMQDLAGNQAVNFSGTTITDNVVSPTLVSAAVANSTPSHIDLTWSKAINSTVSANTAFAVSAGHALTAHTYVDSTHSYLTTSSNFVAGETKTLSYTVPGSSKMQDTNGNLVAAFSGTAITDNVNPSAGILTYTGAISTPGSLDLNAVATTDWINAFAFGANWLRKAGSSATIVPYGSVTATPGLIGVNVSVPAGTEVRNAWTGADSGTMGPNTSDEGYNWNSDSSGAGFTITIPVATVEQICDVYIETGAGSYHVIPSLSDASATLSAFTISPGDGAYSGHRFHIKGGSSTTFVLTMYGSTTDGATNLSGTTVAVYPA
jgi:hypothetical protein